MGTFDCAGYRFVSLTLIGYSRIWEQFASASFFVRANKFYLPFEGA
jgi:hypothetical protein